jgi:hypothetical protein
MSLTGSPSVIRSMLLTAASSTTQPTCQWALSQDIRQMGGTSRQHSNVTVVPRISGTACATAEWDVVGIMAA